jgi:hypothetical protein
MKQSDSREPPRVGRRGREFADRIDEAGRGCQERGVTAMMRLNTEPTTPGLRTGRKPADGMALLIQVPRVAEPRRRGGVSRPEAAGSSQPAWPSSPGGAPTERYRSAVRPRRRLRRGVRRAGWSLLVLASMAATFTMGWTTRGGGPPRLAILGTPAFGHDMGRAHATFEEGSRPWPDVPADADADADAVAIGPAVGPPVADAEVPVVFPGYVLPDDRREEPAHEGG